MTIKAVIFDWGGVFTINGTFTGFCKYYGPKVGFDPVKLKKASVKYWVPASVGDLDSKLYWEKTAKEIGINPVDFKRELLEFASYSPEVTNLLRKLKKNYKTALLSNQIEDWLEELLNKYELRDLFDVIVASYNVKLVKPNPEIYKLTYNRLNLQPEECVFIDDVPENLLPAKELGMKTILFNNFKQAQNELKSLGVNCD
jgi:putative hydrolase of the HAD superfamily